LVLIFIGPYPGIRTVDIIVS